MSWMNEHPSVAWYVVVIITLSFLLQLAEVFR